MAVSLGAAATDDDPPAGSGGEVPVKNRDQRQTDSVQRTEHTAAVTDGQHSEKVLNDMCVRSSLKLKISLMRSC